MVICEEESIENNTKAKGKEAIVVPMAANKQPCPNQTASSSLLLQQKHSLSLTFLRDFQGVVVKLYQAPEITRNFVTFLPSGSQLKLSIEVPQTTNFLPTNNNSMKILGWNNNKKNTEPANRSQIIKTLREVVKRSVVKFRVASSPMNLNDVGNFNDVVEAVPVSFRPPTATGVNMVLAPKKRVTTLLVGETLLSFELPHNCPFEPEELDKLAEAKRGELMTRPNLNGGNIYNVLQYNFLQRLEGWKLERRQRVNGRYDMYYHHIQSRRVFRSITEVVNFFMYELYPDKPIQRSANKSKLGVDDLSGKRRRTEKKEKSSWVASLKRKFDESKKPREKWKPMIYDLNADIPKEYDDHHSNPIYKNVHDHDHHHIPFFDLNDDHDHQKADDDHHDHNDQKPIFYDLVDDDDDDEEDNYKDQVEDDKETVEKFLAESYQNLLNLPHAQKSKSTSFSFDINEEIIEEVDEGDNFNPNDQSVEELLAEAYNNLINYPRNEAKLQKGKGKRTRSIEEKPIIRRKKVRTFTPKCFPSFPNPPININSIPSENNNNNKEKEKEKEKEKITAETVLESMEVQKEAPIIPSVKHKRFNIKEVNGKVIFTDVDCEPNNYGVATTMAGDGGGSSSAMEVAKSVAFLHMDECDLINHIPESSDMFDLAMFLANNRGNNGGF